MRSRYAGQPFTTSTPEIAAALEDVSIPTLLLSLVHITGDPRFIRDFKQMGIFLNEVQGFMSEEDKARARAEALSVITDYRDRGCPEPEPLSPELIREMMDWAACEHVPDDYLALVSEELDLDGRRPPPPGRPAHRTHGRPPGPRHRMRRIGHPGGNPAETSQHRLHHRGEERRARRNMVGEQLSRRPRGCREPLLLLQLRTQQRLDAFLRRAVRAARLLHQGDRQARLGRTHPVEHRGCSRPNGTTTTACGPFRCARPTVRPSTLRARAVITAVGQLNRPHIPDIRRRRHVRGAVVSLRGLGPLGRPDRQAGRTHRGRRQRLSDRARDRQRRRTPHRIPADRPVDVPESDVPRRGRRRCALGDAPPAVLRKVVPLPGAVARIRQGSRRRRRRPELRRPGPRRQRHQRRRPHDVLAVDHQPDRRRPDSRSYWPRSCPTIPPAASGRCRTTEAGCKRCSATTSNWCVPRSGRSPPAAWSPTTVWHTTRTSSCTPPDSGTPMCCGR